MLDRACNSAYVQLHAQIAVALLQLGKCRLARIYVERVYGPFYGLDDRGHRAKLPLAITTGEVSVRNPEDYVKLLAVAAQISLAHGHDREAIEELSEASKLDPLNLEIREQLEDLETRVENRYQRRRSTQKLQRRSLESKKGGM